MRQIHRTEAQEAKLLTQLLSYQKITINNKKRPLNTYFPHLANGGSRNVIEARNLKLQNVLPGVSDYFLAIPSGRYHGAWIELKSKKKSALLSESQKEWLLMMNEMGYYGVVAYGADDALKKINDYLAEKVEITI